MPFVLTSLAAMNKFGSSSSRESAAGPPNPEEHVPSPGFFGSLKDGLRVIKKGIFGSWKIKLIIVFGLILLICNIALISTNHYNVNHEGMSVATNAMYLTTTQMTTIGYGDVIPQTEAAKWFSSFAHLVILFLTLGLAEEFGAITVARHNQTKKIESEIKKEFRPVHRKLTAMSKELVCDIEKLAQKDLENKLKDNGGLTISDVVNAERNIIKKEDAVMNARGMFVNKVNKIRAKNAVMDEPRDIDGPTIDIASEAEVNDFY